MHIIVNDFYEGICVEFERKQQHKIALPTFKSPALFYD